MITLKRRILKEVLISTILGIMISIAVTQTVGHFVLGLTISISQNLMLTLILTGTGIIKGYWIRHYFEKQDKARRAAKWENANREIWEQEEVSHGRNKC